MAGFAKKIYDSLPYPFKVLALNIKGFLNTRQRYNELFKKQLKIHTDLWNADLDKVIAYQNNTLAQLLTEVYTYSAWYAALMKDRGITLEEIAVDPMGVLKKMPILEKIDRREQVEQIVNTKRKTVAIGHTNGTTGTPMLDYLDIESINASFALWKRFHAVIGVTPKSRQARFSGRLIVDIHATRPPYWVYNYFENQLLMSSYHLAPENMAAYVKKLNHFKPELIDGFPSAIFVLSMFINKNDIVLEFRPKAVAVTSETMYDYQRIEIEKAFQCHVYNQYASNEGSPFITECVAGNLHVNLDSGVFEFINAEGEAAIPGEMATLCVTSFINYKTPLIRYNIGDNVLLPKDNTLCECGCQMPMVEKIIGREDDILYTDEKGYVVGADAGLSGIEGIIQGQIVQQSLDQIDLNLVIDDGFDQKNREQLLTNLRGLLGQQLTYSIHIVDDIPMGPNNKFRMMKRNFNLEF